MSVAIVIPSLNSPILDRVIAAIEGQDGIAAVDEIVVVGRDEAGLLPVDGRARLLDTGAPIPPGAARNLGIAATTADRIIFLDSDCLPQPGWLRAHLAAATDGHPVVGGGVVPDGENYWSLVYNLAMFHDYLSTAAAGPRPFLPTLNLAVDRPVIERVGGLDESLIRSQDLDWTARMAAAGFQPYFWPEATVRHWHNRTTAAAVWRDCARSGYHARQVRLAHGEALGTPGLLRSRRLTWALSSLIAAGVTARIVAKRPAVFLHRPHTLPAVFLTKVAWCWGASRPVEPR